MRIEFDEIKRAVTLESRRLDMGRSAEVLTGATLTVEDDRRDYGEDRYITVGFLKARWWSSSGHPATMRTG